MPRPHPTQVRQIVIRQYLMGIDVPTIHSLTGIPTRTIYDYIERHNRSGTILTESERFGDDRGRPRVIGDDELMVMCYVWTRDPTLYLDEVALEMSEIMGKYINPNLLYYWRKKLGITRKKLWRVCTNIYLYCLI